jgi:hypothetical protein
VKSLRLALSLLCSVVLAASEVAEAGTVYVPLTGSSAVGATTYEPQVTITNSLTQLRTVNSLLLATSTDGTLRTGVTPAVVSVPAKQSFVVKPAPTFRGLLELDGPIDFQYSARLVGTGGATLGVELPIVTSQNLGVANDKLVVQGLRTGGTRSADLTIVNLGKQTANCSLELLRSDGTQIAPLATVVLQPLSHRFFANILSSVPEPGLTDARAVVVCTKEFYAFAQVSDTATGEIAVLGAAASGKSTLFVPGAQAPCPVGATCMERLGVVHQPTLAKPVGHLVFPATAGTIGRVKMSLDVTVGPWFKDDPDGKHLIYWFVVNKNIDMLGMLYFRGPSSYTALARHGMGLPHAQKLKLVDKNFAADVGKTYHCENDYDMAGGVYTITITDKDTGVVKSLIQGKPNVGQFTLKTGDQFVLDIGFPEGKVPDEVPGYGSIFSDVRIVVYPK